jgi:hypothetical protein
LDANPPGWRAVRRFGCIEMVGPIKKIEKNRGDPRHDSLLLWPGRSRINLTVASTREFATSVTVGNGPTWPKRTPSRSLGQAVRKDRFGAWAPNCQPSDAPEIPQPQSAEGAPLPRPHSGVPTTGTDRLSLFRRPFRGKEHHAEDAIAREKSKAFHQCAHTRAAAVVGSGETRLSEGWSASLLRLSPR